MIQSYETTHRITLGERVGALRRQAEITQEQLAGRAGLTQQFVSALERGGRLQQASRTILGALAEGLGLELAELLKGTALEGVFAEVMDEDAGRHMAYCPNPFCPRNRIEQGVVRNYVIRWNSGEMMNSREWEQAQPHRGN